MPIEICIKKLNGDGEALIYYYTFFFFFCGKSFKKSDFGINYYHFLVIIKLKQDNTLVAVLLC